MTPHFTAVVVTTLDGKIAKGSGQQVDWASSEDHKHLLNMINSHDVIIVGRNTFAVAKKSLSPKEFATRKYIVLTRRVETTKKDSPQVLYANPQAVDLRQLVQDLGYNKILVLGGGQIYGLLLKQRLIDEIYLTIEPIIFGHGIDFLDTKLPNLAKFNLTSIKKLNNNGTILLNYHLA